MPGFCYADLRVVDGPGETEPWVELQAPAQRRALCSICKRPTPTYDQRERREWRHVGPWRIVMRLFYTPRRVDWAVQGVHGEAMPWNEGKQPWTRARMVCLAQWARRLSWQEAASALDVSGETVYRSVPWIVAWGLAHRRLAGITAIGLDERHGREGKKSAHFQTLIHQVAGTAGATTFGLQARPPAIRWSERSPAVSDQTRPRQGNACIAWPLVIDKGSSQTK